MKYVIIGNSAAGIACVEGIRQIDKKGSITLVTHEACHTYSRPLISYLVQGKLNTKKMMYRNESFYKDNDVDFISGVSAEKIEVDKKTVSLSNGKDLAYDKLLVATGSSAFVPPIEGLDEVNSKTTFMSLADAEKLQSLLEPGKKVIILGAGLIGLKCAEALLGKNYKPKIIDLAPRVLASILDEAGAAMMQKHFEDKGAEFLLSKSISRVEATKGKKSSYLAILNDETKLDFDVLVLAAGVRPNTSLLSGIAEIGRGIAVNTKSESTSPGIYAAGDCTETMDISSGQRKIMALLPNAYMQGECAGVNMAGGDMIFDRAIPMNAIGFMGLHIVSAGSYSGEVYESNKNGTYKKLFFSDNKLNGFIFIGDIDKAGIYTSLIREGTALDTIDFNLICEKPGLMAFTKEVRAEKLGAGKGGQSGRKIN